MKMQNIDWELLKSQKDDLIRLINKTEKELKVRSTGYILVDHEDLDSLNGILNLIDSIQDSAVASGNASESEVFNVCE